MRVGTGWMGLAWPGSEVYVGKRTSMIKPLQFHALCYNTVHKSSLLSVPRCNTCASGFNGDKAAIHFFSDQALNNSQGTKSTWISLFLWIQLKINDAINAIDTKEWSNRAEKKTDALHHYIRSSHSIAVQFLSVARYPLRFRVFAVVPQLSRSFKARCG